MKGERGRDRERMKGGGGETENGGDTQRDEEGERGGQTGRGGGERGERGGCYLIFGHYRPVHRTGSPPDEREERSRILSPTFFLLFYFILFFLMGRESCEYTTISVYVCVRICPCMYFLVCEVQIR